MCDNVIKLINQTNAQSKVRRELHSSGNTLSILESPSRQLDISILLDESFEQNSNASAIFLNDIL